MCACWHSGVGTAPEPFLTTQCLGQLFSVIVTKHFVLRAEASLSAVQGRVSSERYAAMVAHTSNPSAHAAVLFEEANLACDLTSYVHTPLM